MHEFGALLAEVAIAPEITDFLGIEPDDGPPPDGEHWREAATTLAEASVFGFAQIDDDTALRAVVAVGHGHGLRVRVTGGDVDAQTIRTDAPWPALVGCLPARDAADGCEVTVPTAELTQARAQVNGQVEDLVGELEQRRVRPEDARAVTEFLHRADDMTACLRVGLRRDGRLRVGPFAIDVHHAPTGRVAVFPESPTDTFTVVGPANAYLLGKTLQHYLADLAEAD